MRIDELIQQSSMLEVRTADDGARLVGWYPKSGPRVHELRLVARKPVTGRPFSPDRPLPGAIYLSVRWYQAQSGQRRRCYAVDPERAADLRFVSGFEAVGSDFAGYA